MIKNTSIFSLIAVGITAIGLMGESANAATIFLNLQGTAGNGLLTGNEPNVASGGSGGELSFGIAYDDVTNLLDVSRVGWGSSQGFNDLSSLTTVSHIHGPTAASNGNGFIQTAGVLFTLNRSTNAVNGGVFTNPLINISEAQETDLLLGKWYINIHTQVNPGGEIRGFLVPEATSVPEPFTVIGTLVGGTAAFRMRKKLKAAN
jgi:CHRD domain